MRSMLPLLLMVLSSTTTVYSLTVMTKNVHSTLVRQVNGKPQLELATRIVEQYSCSSDHIRFTLQFIMKNVGSTVLIIDKSILIAEIMVSRNLKSAGSKRYEQELRYDLFDMPTSAPSDLSSFVILSPGNVYEFENRVSVTVNDGSPQFKVGLGPGPHFLQIGVATWYYMADPMPFRRRWKDKGYLWSKSLTSLPMPFTVEMNRPIKNCK
jgi:hypothetical protein